MMVACDRAREARGESFYHFTFGLVGTYRFRWLNQRNLIAKILFDSMGKKKKGRGGMLISLALVRDRHRYCINNDLG